MCPCAQNVQLCIIVRGRTDPQFGAVWSYISGKWDPGYVHAVPQCAIEVIIG